MSTVEPPAARGSASSLAPSSSRLALQHQQDGSGLAMVLGCYLLWGFFPLYFKLLAAAGPVEIIGHRIVWTLVTCLLLVAFGRRWRQLRRVLATPRLLGALATAGVLVSVNWLIYVYGVNAGRTADAALGYFMNPLVTVALAALVLGERLRPSQLAAIGLATAGVAVMVAWQGTVPWVSLGLALTFGFYGLVKKRVGGQVDALSGLTVESLVVMPAALGYLGWLQVTGTAAYQQPGASTWLGGLLVVAGPVTALPLLLFAAGTARVPLSVVGLSQYIAPIMQFLLAWLVFGEEISSARWIAMGLVWLAVLVFVVDLLAQLRSLPRSRSGSGTKGSASDSADHSR
ncbi:putative chloramphenical resistance permease RarD [Actinomyces bovis]|uniref:Chloramphenical resistance permease RarD n=1 Tax=Actinomyces bovis TaxID=1658 RepID=A0ABY1VLS1_9ACTO|nr:EamA family transporter RarD [Actinomyces bovis]SPT52622.1 putative chloramphenical resistance permease RarD [Actinomyces bovis]VEG54484.1 putative chloramphenical resistance permease RarD [Actinomyces israelii]